MSAPAARNRSRCAEAASGRTPRAARPESAAALRCAPWCETDTPCDPRSRDSRSRATRWDERSRLRRRALRASSARTARPSQRRSVRPRCGAPASAPSVGRANAAKDRRNARRAFHHADVIVAEPRDGVRVGLLEHRHDVSGMRPIAQPVRPIDQYALAMQRREAPAVFAHRRKHELGEAGGHRSGTPPHVCGGARPTRLAKNALASVLKAGHAVARG